MRRRQGAKRKWFFIVLIVFLVGGLSWKFIFSKNLGDVNTVSTTNDVDINSKEFIESNHKLFLESSIANQIQMMKAVIAEEQRRKEENIKKSMYFVKKNNTVLYNEDLVGVTDIKLSSKTKVFITDIVAKDVTNDDGSSTTEKWAVVKTDYHDGDALGWVNLEKLTQDRKYFITKPYEGVDYGYFEKTKGYKNNPPVIVKGIYVTGHAASGEKFDKLLALADRTAINAFVIDVRDDNEVMLFDSATAQKYSPSANKKPYIKDMKAFMDKLKEHNIYAIARIVTFKTPKYAKDNPDRAILRRGTNELYQSRDGIRWATPYDRDLWDYNIGVAKEAAEHGFNEIQFDYVRFPASGGGKLDASLDYHNDLDETKAEAVQKFLKSAYHELSKMEVYVSADVFGWVASAINDVGIGQHWEGLTAVTDYMCPMMYPSHYGAGNYGLSVPDAYPYETIDRGIKDAISRDSNVEMPAKLRPWIQDFTASWVKGHIKYGPAQIEAQIKALEDNGVDEYLLWNAANVYTEGGIR